MRLALTARATLLALLLAAPVALADGPSEDGSVAGWQQGLRAVLTVIGVVVVAVVARRLGSRASSWSARRRRAGPEERHETDPTGRNER